MAAGGADSTRRWYPYEGESEWSVMQGMGMECVECAAYIPGWDVVASGDTESEPGVCPLEKGIVPVLSPWEARVESEPVVCPLMASILSPLEAGVDSPLTPLIRNFPSVVCHRSCQIVPPKQPPQLR